jgi:DNA-binding response OmpR family regulator
MKSVTTVLFVENDAVALTMYQKRLQREGLHVETAEDGIAALKVLSEMTPDIVILDLILPKFSGRDVFDYMRADEGFRQVPVIIFSNAPKSDWPTDIESSPTKAMPKSEANFSSLMQLIREMTAAAQNAAAAPVAANGAEPQPALVVQTTSSTATTGETAAASQLTTAESAEQFLQIAVAEMPIVREQCLSFIKAPTTDAGRGNLATLRQRLQAFEAGAKKTGCGRLALLAGAWEPLLAEIERKPAITSPSILQTLAQAADCLRILLNGDKARSMEPLPTARALSVDDDEICNHVAVSALQRANIGADSVQDANAAVDLLKQNDYDIVLLDINMPGLTGFELCEKLRAMPQHTKTPVIFVTAFNNFENRKQSVLSGGGDLIAKPVSPMELSLKVTIHLLKAPPKPVSAPAAAPVAVADSGLVWKEPAQTISHDTEMFLKGVAQSNRAPNLVAPATETRTAEPEPVVAAAPAVAATKVETKPAVPVVPQEISKPAPAIPAGPLAALKMTPEPKPTPAPATPAAPIAPVVSIPTPVAPAAPIAPVASVPVAPIAPAAPIQPVAPTAPVAPAAPVKPVAPIAPAPAAVAPATPAPAVPAPKAPVIPPPVAPAVPSTPPLAATPAPAAATPKPILESTAKSSRLSNEGTVVPQPPRSSEPAAVSKNGAKAKEVMSNEKSPQFDTLVTDVAQIIFGDNPPDINVRLVRMALEQVWQHRAELQSLDAIAREIARIIFGDSNTSDLNVRLVKMALERSNSIALFKAA